METQILWKYSLFATLTLGPDSKNVWWMLDTCENGASARKEYREREYTDLIRSADCQLRRQLKAVTCSSCRCPETGWWR